MTAHVYIMANWSRTLYIGVTAHIERRVYEHKHGAVDGFTSRYRLTRLVYVEEAPTIVEAIAREKQLKGWRRDKKVALIEHLNPNWDDLSADWF